MVIGRGRRREHLIYENKRGGSVLWYADIVENTPNQHFVLLLRKEDGKKKRENSTEKKVRVGGSTGKKVREKYGGNCTGKMYRQKVWEKKYGEKKETEGKHKTNGEINEKTNKKRQRESNRPCIMSLHFGDSSIYF
jgi:hypothetical protein